MRSAIKYFLASAVLVVAGITGIGVSTTPAAEYIRNPYYRDALALEKEFTFVDIVQFKTSNNKSIVMTLQFVEEGPAATPADLDEFGERLGDVFQKYIKEDTPFAAIWVVVPGRDGRFYANGLFTVAREDLHAEGVTIDSMKPSQEVYFRWVIGTPYQFKQGALQWAGR